MGSVKTGKASKAAQVFEQTQIPKLAEDGTRGDSTLLAEADDLGLGINRPSERFPEISGPLIVDIESVGEFADRANQDFEPGTAFSVKDGKVSSELITPIDKFALAKSEIEATGLKSGELISFGNLLGFETPSNNPEPII